MQSRPGVFKSFWLDGFGWLSLFAPVASLTFTVCKFWGVTVTLDEYSYAWGLLPLFVLVLIAYYRRWRFAESLLDQLEPKITLSVEKKIGNAVQIAAEYQGKKYADDMKLVLHSVEKEDGSLVHKLNESLTRAMTGSEVVPLRPGDPKTFDVAKLNTVMYPNSDLQLAYLKRIGDRGLDKHRVDRMLMPDTYILNVRAVSKRTQPTIEKFRLSYTDDQKLLTLEKIEKEALKWRMADIFRSKKPAKLRS